MPNWCYMCAVPHPSASARQVTDWCGRYYVCCAKALDMCTTSVPICLLTVCACVCVRMCAYVCVCACVLRSGAATPVACRQAVTADDLKGYGGKQGRRPKPRVALATALAP